MRSAGGGVLLGLRAGHTPIAIDIGARGVRHDRVTYVPAGGLTQNSDGTFTARQVTTPVDMRVYQIGGSIGIREPPLPSPASPPGPLSALRRGGLLIEDLLQIALRRVQKVPRDAYMIEVVVRDRPHRFRVEAVDLRVGVCEQHR